MPNSSKIAIVSPVWPPYHGGMSNVAYQHARLLAERGQVVTVFTPAYALRASAGRPDYTISTTPHPNPLLREERGYMTPSPNYGFCLEPIKPVFQYGNAAWVPTLKDKLKDFRVVILQYPFFGGMKAVYQAKKKYDFKLLINYNMDVVASGLKGLLFAYATKYFLPRIVKAADIVLASSRDYAQHSNLRRYWQEDSDKFKILPIGVDISKFVPGAYPRQKIVLFVGGLDKAHYFKGVEYLIRAASLLSGDFKIVIAGDGDLLPVYKKSAQAAGVAERISFVGGVSNEVLVKLYQQATVTVLPSVDQSESFGLVLVESLACATPIIASDLPGVRAVYQDGVSGFTVPVKDINVLAEKINFLLNNPTTVKEMGEAGRRLIEEKYDWEKIGDEFLSLMSS